MMCHDISEYAAAINADGKFQTARVIMPPPQAMEIGMKTEGIALIPRPSKNCGLMVILEQSSGNDKKIYKAINRGIENGIIDVREINERIILDFHFSLSSVGILFAKCTIPHNYICLFTRYTIGKKELADFTVNSLNNSIAKLEVNNKDWNTINKILKMPDPA
ncbi:hypothetical protein LQZ19_05290 [Treponema primitia]|uniref:hypothetical protein n=1 Tax=Treponema primitia TaxID=88058 RepID=UPI003980BD02